MCVLRDIKGVWRAKSVLCFRKVDFTSKIRKRQVGEMGKESHLDAVKKSRLDTKALRGTGGGNSWWKVTGDCSLPQQGPDDWRHGHKHVRGLDKET